MITADMRTLSPAEFAATAAETFARLNTPNPAGITPAEVVTVDGEPRAVLLSPETFAELVYFANLEHDVEQMRRSLKQIEAGECVEAGVYFDGLRARLLAMKAEQELAGAK